MSNFLFLSEWPELQQYAQKAEAVVNADPRSSCFYSRYTLERTVQWMYEFDKGLQKPKYDQSLNTLINQSDFKAALGSTIFPKIKAVQKAGNNAVHSERKVTEPESTQALKELHHILYWFYRTYSSAISSAIQQGQPLQYQVFDLAKLPKTVQISADLVMQSAKQLKLLQKQLTERDEAHQQALDKAREQNTALQQQLQALQNQLAQQKVSNAKVTQKVKDPHDYNEAETREFIIDQYLKEMGWQLDAANVKEYEVKGMPPSFHNKTGAGFIDYVLWGADGKPLAVVEAKRTMLSAKDGRQQAICYADCLEKAFGQRPLIYYTNGYEIHFWDDCQYPPRLVQGFLNQDEMQRLINRRTARQALSAVELDTSIAGKGRPYQRQAIESVCQQFDVKKQRKALLVMATGTGKTRTTIALVDVLMRAGLVKNTLFLADRNALVNQAKKEFSKLLPKSSPEILSSGTSQLKGRVYLSTYPTMMGLLSAAPDSRLFGVGHFDLVIVDEAHRSVYKKYRYIFDYFDALLLGLTATPKAELDKNTYDIFEQPEGDPTFAYELEQAIADKVLVPPKDVKIELGFIRKGIKYAELTAAEKEEWESKEQLEGKEEVLPSEVNKFLFNKDTVDKALQVLMERGVMVAGGTRLGKTIIFAANNDHAEFIVERINANYPSYKGKFARVITYKEKYADTLIDEFKGEKPPADPNLPLSIAVSVDMLDTGIDVPEVVNLMFFKVIKSKVKFMQMLGRGTRLCEDLFGPADHKQFFKVFDCCKNFEYFEMNPEGAKDNLSKSLTQAIFESRLQLSQRLKDKPEFGNFGIDYQQYNIRTLQHRVAGMKLDNFIVRAKRQLVEKYQQSAIWQHLTNEHLAELEKQIAILPSEATPLIPEEKEEELSLRFDQLLLTMQLALVNKTGISDFYRDKLTQIAAKLESKASVPAVMAQLEWIQYVQSSNFWTDITLEDLEKTRLKLRLLMRFIEKESTGIVFTNFQDQLLEVHENDGVYEFSTDSSLVLYRKKVEAYIREHEDDLTIQRIKRNQAITKLDLQQLDYKLYEASGIADLDQYNKTIHPDKSVGEFVRELVGLDRGAAKVAFADYLDSARFNPQQLQFVNTIIDYLTQNGVMSPAQLAKPPFSDIHFEGVFGLFDDNAVIDIRNRVKGVSDVSALVVDPDFQIEKLAIGSAKLVLDEEFGAWSIGFANDLAASINERFVEALPPEANDLTVNIEVTEVKAGSVDIDLVIKYTGIAGAAIMSYPVLRAGFLAIWRDLEVIYVNLAPKLQKKYQRNFKTNIKASELRLMTDDELLESIKQQARKSAHDRKTG
ncbi:DEAD/DEAH box helicase family protein [Rheinheimera sp. FR7-31]|uniref:DEAD/DEAH box helicase family protein n=1 Tax=Rheinheimera fenheensis TaxID=3152295 RepID=UPI00325D21B6